MHGISVPFIIQEKRGGGKLNSIEMTKELELKERLYTVRQQKKILENRLNKFTFRCQNIPDLQKEEARAFKAGIPTLLFYLLFTLLMVVIFIWCILQALQGNGTGNEMVGFGLLISIPMLCLGIIRVIPRAQVVIMAFCKKINLQKEEENLYFKMGNLCTEMAKAEEEIQKLEEQLKDWKKEQNAIP